MSKITSLKKPAEFRYIYRKGASVVAPAFVIYAVRSRGKRARLGLTAGKKVGGAVQRNRAKRRLRELFRKHSDKIKPGYDFVIVLRAAAVKFKAPALERSFLNGLRNLNVLNAD